jgi:hypothetical protein
MTAAEHLREAELKRGRAYAALAEMQSRREPGIFSAHSARFWMKVVMMVAGGAGLIYAVYTMSP